MRTKRSLAFAASALGITLTLAACGANSGEGNQSGNTGATSEEQQAAPNGTVGVILPETATSARWEGFDKPMIEKALRAEGFDPDVQNAQGDVQKFTTLADGMISQGVKVLVIASINSEVGSAVAAKAKNAGIPTIDYDRLNLGGGSDYYVSFDNVKVGELQGEGLAKALEGKQGAQVIEIEGAPTDNNATLFHEGQRNILQPLYDSGALKLVQSQPIDDWNNQRGGTTFEQILTGNGGRVDGVVAANDGLAGAIITVLQKNGLAGTVPVTGQDATPDGLKAILRGDQYMTVFKPIQEEADATAKLAAALAKGDTAAADALAKQSSHDPEGNREVKSVLLEPYLITKNEVKRVIDDGYVKASEVCTGDLQQVCSQLGIS
ncbi:sugar ABC transporter substrate-binding protein [Prauserella marina]|uniref:D-xylose transport system substrate-binding protein n=1 Tax=Prauserella marina TaxID=530584 RepID=A0A222VNH2_9PSEU|nr:substrate-binding domain-containing protein [Prauserella marina]ASR35457.1 sugar ABC transporter substrate-binding protein [Prauserella marina]PWV84729.1 monosaccharide ABC transporter substrate-binding protein (CUT2 family) [Prauserella marina]SDC14655.1 D-xylose transport system substrate-binding protein [Prauserella marina]